MNDTPFLDNQHSLDYATMLVIAIAAIILIIIPCWRIFEKAGFSGWWSFGMAVPLINIILIYYLAFVEWPVRKGVNRAIEPPPAPPRRPAPPERTL